MARATAAYRSAHETDRSDRGHRYRNYLAAEISGSVLASAPDNLSLFKMHGRHVDLSIADQMVKTYIEFVADDAAPYPPPSDPRLSDVGFKPYPPPSAWVQPV